MMATFEFTVTIETDRVEGRVVSNEVLEESLMEQLQDAVDGLDLGDIGEFSSVYDISDSNLTGGHVRPTRKARPKAAAS
jgi:hypothetical protein